jgi:hypothetical protein
LSSSPVSSCAACFSRVASCSRSRLPIQQAPKTKERKKEGKKEAKKEGKKEGKKEEAAAAAAEAEVEVKTTSRAFFLVVGVLAGFSSSPRDDKK